MKHSAAAARYGADQLSVRDDTRWSDWNECAVKAVEIKGGMPHDARILAVLISVL